MTENSTPKIAGLLLAAGGSSRLGRPKQLVEFEGKTLIRRAAEALIQAGCSPVIVVLGSEIEESRRSLGGLCVTLVENLGWHRGMGSSIGCGIAELRTIEPLAAGVLITTCDQPSVTGTELKKFADRSYGSPTSIIAAEYAGVLGVPAFFPAVMFDDLETLDADKGARDLIRNSPVTLSIALPEAALDVDTSADLERLENLQDL